MVFAVIFTAVDTVNKQVMLNPDNDVFNNLINRNINFSDFGFENFNLGQSEKATGECSDDKPLLLTNGVIEKLDIGR